MSGFPTLHQQEAQTANDLFVIFQTILKAKTTDLTDDKAPPIINVDRELYHIAESLATAILHPGEF